MQEAFLLQQNQMITQPPQASEFIRHFPSPPQPSLQDQKPQPQPWRPYMHPQPSGERPGRRRHGDGRRGGGRGRN